MDRKEINKQRMKETLDRLQEVRDMMRRIELLIMRFTTDDERKQTYFPLLNGIINNVHELEFIIAKKYAGITGI